MNEDSLFVAALEKPTAAERRDFLERARAGDAALRRRVERLLAAHLRTHGILDQPAGPPGWTEVGCGSPHGGVPPGEIAGTLIAGRYRLVEVICGRGRPAGRPALRDLEPAGEGRGMADEAGRSGRGRARVVMGSLRPSGGLARGACVEDHSGASRMRTRVGHGER